MTRTTVRVDDDPPAPAQSTRVGDVIAGRYRLERALGEGGMGAVYEATHTFTHHRVAVKLVHRALAAEPRAESRLAREARALALFDHPGIVGVLDGGRDADGTLFLVEALLDGQDLGKTLAAGPLDFDTLAVVALETLDALAAAHARGLVHRDIKPENIFLARDPSGRRRVKLVDFGIVRVVDGGEALALQQTGGLPTQTGSIVGTPRFMSPEQARGEAVDPRTDLWSLGAVMFFALTGRHAVEADNYNALIIRLATTTPPPIATLRADVPPALAAVVDRALARDLDARWPSAAAMADALRPLAPPALQVPPGVSLPPPPPAARSPAPAHAASRPPATAALALGLVLGGFAGAALRSAPSSTPTAATRQPAAPARVARADGEAAAPPRATLVDAAATPDAVSADRLPASDASRDTGEAGVEAGAPSRPLVRRPRPDEPIRQMGE